MRKIREILRLCWHQHLSTRQAAASCGISQAGVMGYLARAKKAGLSWPLPDGLDEATLENMLFAYPLAPDTTRRSMPSYEYLHEELRKKHVTLQLLWKEYRDKNPEGYEYSQFCLHYRTWANTLDIALRQDYKAGEKLFVDFAGDTISIHDPSTGATTQAHLFVATLGASNYSYVEATPSQELPHWVSCHIHTFEFMGAVPAIVIPDNLKSGVTHPSRYEPDLNPTYADLAAHYGTVVIPARVKKARDKAKVESSVLIVERWILAALRNHTFFSIGDLNRVLGEKLEELNSRPLQVLKVSRKHLFETIDKPAMQPLPERRYELATWEKHKVNIDYHVEVDHHYYSVPYQLRGAVLDARITASTVELLFKGKRVASHPRSYLRGRHTTESAHMPEAHKRYLAWTPSRIIMWAEKTGPHIGALVKAIIEQRPHPEQGFRSSLGIMRLKKRYGDERLEAACARALMMKAYSYRSVESILKNNLDGQELTERSSGPPVVHENIRGNTYYTYTEETNAERTDL